MLQHAHLMSSSSWDRLIFSDMNMTQMDLRTQLLTWSLSALLFMSVTWSRSTHKFPDDLHAAAWLKIMWELYLSSLQPQIFLEPAPGSLLAWRWVISSLSLLKDPGLSGIHCQRLVGHYSLCFGILLQINCLNKAPRGFRTAPPIFAKESKCKWQARNIDWGSTGSSLYTTLPTPPPSLPSPPSPTPKSILLTGKLLRPVFPGLLIWKT